MGSEMCIRDRFTMRRYLCGARDGAPAADGTTLEGLTVAIVGDILHSRVVRSNVDLLHTLGAEAVIVGPPTLIPVGAQTWKARISYDLDEVIRVDRPDAVMTLRVQRERMSGAGGGYFPSPQEYTRAYGLDAERLAAMQDHAIVMHPGPMNRGVEIDSSVADGAHSVILSQVTFGIAVRMAVMSILAGNA